VGAGPGLNGNVRTVAADGTLAGAALAPFGPAYTGAASVARGDVDPNSPGDEIIVGTGQGFSPPVVDIFSATGGFLRQFLAYDPGFQGGVSVAVGDVNPNSPGREIITGAGPGGGPHVKVFSGDGTPLAGFFAYDAGFHGGVSVAAANVTGDAPAEIITGAGPGGGPHVKVFAGDGTQLAGFFAYDGAFTGGVNVAAGALDNGGLASIVTGPGPGGGPNVKAFTAAGGQLVSFMAYDPGFSGGVRVAAGLLDGLPTGVIVTGPGSGGGPHVRVFTGAGTASGSGFMAFDPSFPGGVYVSIGSG